MYSNWAVGFKMFIILYIGWATCLSCSHADDIFPEALVFEGLGLSDMINNSKSDENHNNTIIIAGDLNDALTTMNFHRYGFYLILIPNYKQIINIPLYNLPQS